MKKIGDSNGWEVGNVTLLPHYFFIFRIKRHKADQTTDGTVVCHTGVIVNNENLNELDEKPARVRADNLKTRIILKVNGANPLASARKNDKFRLVVFSIKSACVGINPHSFGFHPAKQDFIKVTRLTEIIFVLASFFIFSRKIQIVHFIPLSFNLWGIVQLLNRRRNSLILVRYYAIINSPINKNLTR